MSAWSKRISRYCFMALAAPMILSLPTHAQNQQQPPPQAQPQPEQQPLSQQQLQQLVAPIALYPDALLAQVLTASTYPLEVTLAARWAEKNANVKGPALEAAMQKEPWDPSVKGLTAVPQVLAMMNEKLDWTAQLGEAFLAQPNDVQTAVQTLRKQAETTGNLKSGKEQKVSRMPAPQGTGYAGPPEYIVIEPLEPDYVYVPVYDPVVIYGPGYWTPAYTPFFWRPSWWVAGPVIAFGAAAFVGPALWYHYNWGHPGFAAIQTNPVLYSKFNKVAVAPGAGQAWKFNAANRGVPFKNTNLQKQFGNVGTRNLQGVQTLRGPQTGTQLGKGAQGVQGVQGGKNVQGLKTSNTTHIQNNKTIQTNRTIQSNKTIQTNKNIQGNRVQGARTTSRVQAVNPGGGNKGAGNKNAGKVKKNP
ncbi:MAG TPA: DUF3300 domain-containing protein [Pseudolabrys sp.]